MATTLSVTKTLNDVGWMITAQLANPSDIPREIFVYLNSGTTSLGEYYGVLNVSDLSRIQIWNSQALPVFGNKFVRHTVANFQVDPAQNVDKVIDVFKISVQLFSDNFKAVSPQLNIHPII